MKTLLTIIILLPVTQVLGQWGISLGMAAKMEGYITKSEGLFKNYLTISTEYEFKKWRVYGDLTMMHKGFNYEASLEKTTLNSTIWGSIEKSTKQEYYADIMYGYGGLQIGCDRTFNHSNKKSYFLLGLSAQLEYFLYENAKNQSIRTTYTTIYNYYNSSQPDQIHVINNFKFIESNKPSISFFTPTILQPSFYVNLGYRINLKQYFIHVELSPGLYINYRNYHNHIDAEAYHSWELLGTPLHLLIQSGFKLGYRFDKKEKAENKL